MRYRRSLCLARWRKRKEPPRETILFIYTRVICRSIIKKLMNTFRTTITHTRLQSARYVAVMLRGGRNEWVLLLLTNSCLYYRLILYRVSGRLRERFIAELFVTISVNNNYTALVPGRILFYPVLIFYITRRANNIRFVEPVASYARDVLTRRRRSREQS